MDLKLNSAKHQEGVTAREPLITAYMSMLNI